MWLLILILPISSWASENWFCTTQSSKIQGSSILACGIGSAATEDEARLKAFDAAKSEFNRICQASDDCIVRAVTIDPMRTTCDKVDGSFQCHRLVSFVLGEANNSKPKAALTKKIRKGMSKEDFLAIWGIPSRVSDIPGSNLKSLYYYGNPKCANVGCSVYISDGKIDSYSDIDPKYIDMLSDI